MDTLKAYQAQVANSKDIDAAYGFCRDLARSHYENFPVASRLLRRDLRRPISALYAFARIADDFADEPEYEGVRQERLFEWRSHLHDLGRRAPTHPVFVALEDSIKTLDLPLELFDDLLSAFIQDTEKSRYADFDSLLDYCRRSANPIGRLVLMIHGYRDDGLMRLSDAVCSALQLANFWQDLAVDLKKDRIYIPEEDFRAFGYTEADMRMGVVNEKFRNLMKFQLKRTRELFDEGRPLSNSLSWPLSSEIRLTWYGGAEILRKIRKSGYDTLSTRPKLSKWDWLPLIVRSFVRS